MLASCSRGFSSLPSVVLENSKYVCMGEGEQVRLSEPIWLLNSKKKSLGASLAALLTSPAYRSNGYAFLLLMWTPHQIPVRSANWPVISKAVATVSLDLTTGEMGAFSLMECQVPLFQKDTQLFTAELSLWKQNLHVASYWKLKFLVLVPL